MPYLNPEDRKAHQHQYYRNNKEKWRESFARAQEKNPNFIAERYAYNRAYRMEHREKAILQRVRNRAKKENLECNLDVSDIHIPTHCPVLGLELFEGYGRQHDASPSVDRINPKLGYLKGNIVIISFLANKIKTDATADQVEAVARWMKNGCPAQ